MLQKKSVRSFANFSKRTNFIRLLIAIFSILLLYFGNSLLLIKKINCTLSGKECPEEIQRMLNKLIDTNSLAINQKQISAEIKSVYPFDKINFSFKLFHILNISLEGNEPYIKASVYLVKNLPVLSMDQAPSTTDSAQWWTKPSLELENFLKSENPLNFIFYANGTMVNTASGAANIKYIFTEKPSPDIISSIYSLAKISEKYLDQTTIIIVNKRCFLSRQGQPDIIMLVPFSEGSLVNALQSLSYLVTIKKDARVIDLSFKNPIVR